MIIVSDNIATNILIDYLGLDTINSCMEKLGCHNTRLHNPLHFERYRTLGTTTPRD
jgi:beta-lactamase class A